MGTDVQVMVQAFNPSEHIIQLKSKNGSADYLPVQYRLVWFREQCPQGTIDTEELEVDHDREFEAEGYAWNEQTRKSERVMKRAKGYARFRAIITDGKGGRATGTKSERAVDFPDYIEKAETGAIGRALAALGYGTQFAPELNEEQRIMDAPVERAEQPVPGTAAAIVRMVEMAKKRALDLGADWELLKTSVLGEPVPDSKLIVHHFTKINGELTKREKAGTPGK